MGPAPLANIARPALADVDPAPCPRRNDASLPLVRKLRVWSLVSEFVSREGPAKGDGELLHSPGE